MRIFMECIWACARVDARSNVKIRLANSGKVAIEIEADTFLARGRVAFAPEIVKQQDYGASVGA